MGRYNELTLLLRGSTEVPAVILYNILREMLENCEESNLSAMEQHAKDIKNIAASALEEAEKKGKKERNKNSEELIETASVFASSASNFTTRQICCHPLMATHINSSCLLPALRKLHSTHLLYLLKYFAVWLSNLGTFDVLHGGHVSKSGMEIVVPSYDTVIEWISLTIDAGSIRMSQSYQAEQILGRVMKEISERVSSIRQYSELKGAIQHITTGAPLSRKTDHQGQYSVECLTL